MNVKDRFWEIDLVRGLAAVMMVVYHFFYDLNFLMFTDLVSALVFGGFLHAA